MIGVLSELNDQREVLFFQRFFRLLAAEADEIRRIGLLVVQRGTLLRFRALTLILTVAFAKTAREYESGRNTAAEQENEKRCSDRLNQFVETAIGGVVLIVLAPLFRFRGLGFGEAVFREKRLLPRKILCVKAYGISAYGRCGLHTRRQRRGILHCGLEVPYQLRRVLISRPRILLQTL